MSGVTAVVVTYNRQALLRRCLDALAAQELAPERILVVDNASTDKTAEAVRREYPHAELHRLERNAGGAGGFHAGMARAFATRAQWLWLMDDDTIPRPDALAALLAAVPRVSPPPLLLASHVVWRDGRTHPLNFPTLERRRMDRVVAAAPQRMLPFRSATFVSLLVHRDAVARYGLPYREFFLWSDDIEYTSRIVLAGAGAYFVPDSVVLHDTAAPADFRTAPPERFYFHARNTLLMARAPGRPARDRLLRTWMLTSTSAAYLRRRRSREAALAIARGVRDGLRDPLGPSGPLEEVAGEPQALARLDRSEQP